MNITDFLLARIAEDEMMAARQFGSTFNGVEADDEEAFTYFLFERQDRECEAKRRIVELCGPIAGYGSTLPAVAMECLLDLATVYNHHPDYREEWRP